MFFLKDKEQPGEKTSTKFSGKNKAYVPKLSNV